MKLKRSALLLSIFFGFSILFGCASTADTNHEQTTSVTPLSEQPVQAPEAQAAPEAAAAVIALPTPPATDNLATPPVLSEQATPSPYISATPVQNQIITGTLKIAFIDVGQGDSIYICLPNGESILIDAGESSASTNVIHFLNENHSGPITYLIATHPHADHIGGMAAVVNSFEVNDIWMPDAIHTTQTFENLLDAIEAKGLSIEIAMAGSKLFDYGNLKAVFIAPNGSDYSNLNNYSAAILLAYNDCRFLFMGDAEKEAEAEIMAAGQSIAADVLKVGHHGSASSSTTAFVKAVAPEYAVISCGKNNSYGHPAKQTLATFAEFGVDVKRTDESGTIIFSCDGETISCTTFQAEVQPRAPDTAQEEAPGTNTVKEAPANTQEQAITVYVTNTGKKYHADGCRYLSQSRIPIDLDAAKQKYEPCSVCNPPR